MTKRFVACLVGAFVTGSVLALLAHFSAPATAAAPSDAEAIVRALDRISDRLDHLNDTLKECRR